MSTLDAMIYRLAFLALVVAIIKRGAFVPALLLCISFLINELIFIKSPSWQQLENLYLTYSIKDFLISIILFMRKSTSEFLLAMMFVTTSSFHWLAKMEVNSYILDLKHARTDFMTYITAFEIAIIYAILIKGGGWHGGKRVRHFVCTGSRNVNNIFCIKAFKAIETWAQKR